MRSIVRLMSIPAICAVCCMALAAPPEKSPNRQFPAKDYADPLEREMIEAAFRGKIDKVKECLAKGARVDARFGGEARSLKGEDGGWLIGANNWTALMAATEADRFEIVDFLLEKGATVKIDDGWGGTPLYTLAEKRKPRKEYDSLAALFIKNGADVNAKTGVYIDGPSGETVLHTAVGWGHVEIVKMLVAAGAKVNVQDSDGRTPLDEVIVGRSDEEIRAILEKVGATSGKKTGRAN
jgi:hypothetical protein